jgi:hypothetical protein
VQWFHVAQADDYGDPIETKLTHNDSLAPGISPEDYDIKVTKRDKDTLFQLTLKTSKKCACHSRVFVIQNLPCCEFTSSLLWSSYDRTWFSEHHKQEFIILIFLPINSIQFNSIKLYEIHICSRSFYDFLLLVCLFFKLCVTLVFSCKVWSSLCYDAFMFLQYDSRWYFFDLVIVTVCF